jgi:hypothetical protein
VSEQHFKSSMWQTRESELDSQKVSSHFHPANRTATNHDNNTANPCHN